MIKVCVLGCGYWGKNLVRNFSELGNLASVSDPNPDNAKAMSEKYSVPALSFEQALQSDCDAIVIAAPAALHASLTEQAINAGKHVFVEKPLALDLDDAKSLCSLAKSSGKTLMVGHLLQYHPAFIKLKQLAESGAIGKIKYIYSNRLNLGKFRREENILWSFAPHDISMILSLTKSVPTDVYATGICHLSEGIHDVTTTHMKFDNNIAAHVFVSWLHPYKEQKLIVVGDDGMMVFDDGQPLEKKLQHYPHKVNWIDGFPHPSKADVQNVEIDDIEPLRNECQHFLDCIENNSKPITNSTEGLHVLKVLDAAQRSLKTNENIKLSNDVDVRLKEVI